MRIFHNKSELFIFITSIILIGSPILFISKIPLKWIIAFYFILVLVTVLTISGNYEKYAFSLLILCIPINPDVNIFLKDQITGSSGLNISMIDVIFLLLLLSRFRKLWERRDFEFRIFFKSTWPVVFYLSLSGLSIIFAEDIAIGIFEFIRLLKIIFIFYYVLNFGFRLISIKQIAVLLVIGLGIEAILGLLQATTGTTIGLQIFGEDPELRSIGSIASGRVSGTIGHPNTFASYLAFLLPVSFSLFECTKKVRGRILFLFVFVVSVIALVFSLSRAGWISWLLAMFFYFTLRIFQKKYGSKTLYLVGGILIIFILIFAMWPKVQNRLYSEDYGAAYSRIPLMKVAISMIKDRPFLGVGLHNYTKEAHKYAPYYSFEALYPVHNSFLRVSAETGILSGLCLLIFNMLIIKIGLRIIRIAPFPEKYLFTGFIAGFIGFIVANQADFPYFFNPLLILFWIISGIIIAYSDYTEA